MKRAWEAIVPPMDTPANIKMRSSIITALEVEEWAFRESVSDKSRLDRVSFYISLLLNYVITLGDPIYNGFAIKSDEEPFTRP